jgi:23S rRNA (cytosine1962-C5)-methyltransferase
VGIVRATPQRWSHADARFDSATKQWRFRKPFPESLRIDCGPFMMPTQPTPFGHIGFFPEQRSNWRWLEEQVRELAGRLEVAVRKSRDHAREPLSHPPEISHPPEKAGGVSGLNLFGYTGASSLALAAAGARVTHVDAAKPNVEAAKAAAEASKLRQAPIRYLVEDARKFVRRELRRGRRYTMIALDPPAYGHGPGGKAWRLERDVWPLLEDCLRLLGKFGQIDQQESDDAPARLLVTGHSESVGPEMVLDWLRSTSATPLRAEFGRSELSDLRGRRLDAGFYLRATWN